ncbi:MAG: YicC family protein [Spirochaetaceae bacterium]|jgi:uncharacterized protein (TIGR00255 family)|nr:YicC family protein [Spirochaetaceae bacterium]
MTGYGYQEKQERDVSFSVEIKGYNSRFLELSVNLPVQFSAMDIEIRRYIASRCRRGKVEVTVHLKEHEGPVSVSVNRAAVAAYRDALKVLRGILGGPEQAGNPSAAQFLSFDGVLEVDRAARGGGGGYWKRVAPVLELALSQFENSRAREGKHTEADILSYLERLETLVKAISARTPELEASIRENIRNRFAELLGGNTREGPVRAGSMLIDENRLLSETAILLMKYTISEELSRLSAHLAEFRAEIGRNPSPGKKLDFLCQEIHREINTIGSKTAVLEISRAVVDMKDVLENIREQLRNIE